mgnify:CR=1 FL=1
MSMTKSPHVFLINEGLHDYSAAAKFGERVISLTQGICSRVNATGHMREIAAGLACSHPDDWLVISGPPLVNILACAEFAVKHGKLNLLIYASREQEYVQRTIVFEKELQ